MDKAKLIEKINILGPWVHGYFDLGDGIVIQDRDLLQKRRLMHYREYFIDIIRNHYGKKSLEGKSLCDIGCNTGYFLYELYKEFGFKSAIGLEPRATNRAKANFIAKYFNLSPSRYQIKNFDVLNPGKKVPVFDVVLFPGVLHHIANHLLALQNLYKMTRDLCIIDTHILPDEVNTQDVQQKMELKNAIYTGIDKSNFGVIGYKLEDSKLDGATIHPGIVGVPTVKALELMLRHVGFSEIHVYRHWRQLKEEVFNGHLHRDVYCAVIVAKQSSRTSSPNAKFDQIVRTEQYREFEETIPQDQIGPCYQFLTNKRTLESLPSKARLICVSQIKKDSPEKQKKYHDCFSTETYFPVLETLKYSPDHKVPFEFAKTSFMEGEFTGAREVLENLCKVVNLDWRIVYKTYHLLTLIALKEEKRKKALKYNSLALQTFPSYYPALDIREKEL